MGKYIMTTALEVTDKDFEQMMQMLTGFWMTQIAGAVAGRERTPSEYSGLLKQAGFRFQKISPLRSSTVVIEAVAADRNH